jgi:lipopolysaccharide transport system permease protein
MGMLKDIWNYRGFILGSVRREFQLKYRNSLLGAAWTVLNPLAMIVVYTVVFSEVMKARLPGVDSAYAYSIYLCSGMLTWNLFAEIMSRSQTIFLENANLLKKVNFPKICLPTIVVLSAGLNFVIIFGLFSIFLIFTDNFPGLVYLDLIPLLFLQILFSISLGVIIGVLNVFFRDVGQLTGVVLQFWFWLTPIVYSSTVLSESIREWMFFNPLANLIGAYQTILVAGNSPDYRSLGFLMLLTGLLCVIALQLFRRRSREMVDEF